MSQNAMKSRRELFNKKPSKNLLSPEAIAPRMLRNKENGDGFMSTTSPNSMFLENTLLTILSIIAT